MANKSNFFKCFDFILVMYLRAFSLFSQSLFISTYRIVQALASLRPGLKTKTVVN